MTLITKETSIKALRISARTKNLLRINLGLETLGDLEKVTLSKIFSLNGMGQTALVELIELALIAELKIEAY